MMSAIAFEYMETKMPIKYQVILSYPYIVIKVLIPL